MNTPEDKEYLTITPLGGLGEIGMNCQLWKNPSGTLLVDCGIMFPDEFQLGIDVIIPAIAPILEQKDRLLGVVLTHGHEDHIGAVPWLVSFIPDLTIYGSPFTLALVSHKLKERALLDQCKLVPIFPKTDLQLGSFCIRPISVSHSIPQSYGFAISTPVGKIVHSGDFKIDDHRAENTAFNQGTDMQAFIDFAKPRGVRLLLSDSTNAESSGHALAEKDIKDNFLRIFEEAQGRIIVTLFSSHIERVQTVFDTAKATNRPVLISGRSLANNIEHASKLNFLNVPPSLTFENQLSGPLSNRTVLIATGSQGEPMATLSRIAAGTYKHLKLCETDTIIMSSRIVPGNERPVNRMVNEFYRAGAKVYHTDVSLVHVTGHAHRGDLSNMIKALCPENFVPIHGEYRHLSEHVKLAQESGVPKENTFLLTNGKPITLTADSVCLEPPISVEALLVDGKSVGDVDKLVLRDRQLLGGDGVVLLSLVLGKESGEILHGPDLFSRGFLFEKSHEELLEEAKGLVHNILNENPRPAITNMHERIRSVLRGFFRKTLGRDPVVMPVISEV